MNMMMRLGLLVVLCGGLVACADESPSKEGEPKTDVGVVEQDTGNQVDVGEADVGEADVDACGGTACSELLIETLSVQDVSANGATFLGVANALSVASVEDHGFCFVHGAHDEICRSLGGLSEVGNFSLVEEWLLPGRIYGVRAYAVAGSERVYGSVVEFTTLAAAVAGFGASQGESEAYVRLHWVGVGGVDGYVLYRDGQEIGRLEGGLVEYLDEQAAAGSAPSEVLDVTASQGDFADYVRVRWEAAAFLPGDEHTYSIVAVYPDAESERTAGVEGYRKAFALKNYEISIDGAGFVDAGVGLSYDDSTTAGGEITAGEISASEATFVEHVVLRVEAAHGVETTDAGYVVRAVSTEVDALEGTAVVGPESAVVRGFRSVGSVSLQWEHSSNDIHYTSIGGATTPVYNHTGAFEDGTPRYYRLRYSAVGAESVYSEVVQGARAFLSVRFVEIPREADINQPFGVEIEVANQFDVPFGGVVVRMMLARDTFPFFAKTFGSQTTDGQGRAVYVQAAPVTWPGMDFLFEAKLPNNRMFYSEQFRVDRAPLFVGSSTEANVAGEQGSDSARLSGDGRYLVFRSDATNLVAGGGNGFSQIYRKDLMEGTVKVVSISQGGQLADHDAFAPSVSANGQFVAFLSYAKNLLSSPITTNVAQVFMKDMETGKVFLISATEQNVVSDRSNFTPAISADGRFVVFGSNATNLASQVVDDNVNHIYRKDWALGALELVTRVSGQPLADWASFEPAISADGSKIVFASFATNLVPETAGPPVFERIFLRDMNAGGAFTLISTNEDNDSADAASKRPSISADGRYVAFVSTAKNFAHNPNLLGHEHIYRKDVVSGAIVYVSTNVAGELAAGDSQDVVISADGRFVVFASAATNYVAGVSGGQVYRKDVSSGKVVLVSATVGGVAGDGASGGPVTSADGRYVAFWSAATNIVGVGGMPVSQVYLRRVLVD